TDEEVRAVVRRIAGLAEAGVPLDRIGVFHPTPDPYVRTLQQQHAEAGIPANGPSRERLADSVAGRTLLGALALPAERWRRDRVMALITGGPVRHGDRRAHPAAWEDISRRAGVVQDLADWREKLAGFDAGLAVTLTGIDAEEHPGWVARLERERADAAALAEFVDDLAAAVGRVGASTGWAAMTGAGRDLLYQLLGTEGPRQSWPEREQDAAARVEDALARLGALDELEPDPSPDVFRRALGAELDVTRGRAGRFGEGVVYGPLTSAAGHDLDAVFILGLAEGSCPTPRRDDSLLPDRARELAVAPDELPARAAQMADQHRAFLAALAAAPPERRWLLHPRGDLRGRRHRLPSRWLLDTAGALAGRPVYSTDFPDLGAPVVDVVASYAAGVAAASPAAPAGPHVPTGSVPASLLDRDLAALSAYVNAGGDAATHPAVAGAGRGFECLGARRSDRFTEWDGNLAGAPVPSPTRGELLSATRLQRWAQCGYRYFLADVLGLGSRDDPERIIELSAIDRGSAVHAILEAFLLEVLAAGAPDPDTPWSPAQRARLQALAGDVFAELERRGRTGRPVHWRLEQERLRALLDDFLTVDDRHRAVTRSRPHRVELPFGLEDTAPVVVELPGGRSVAFRGKADRVDVAEDGVHFVSDYKTGRGKDYDKLHEGDPTRAGTLLQLGLYSEAALHLLGAAEAEAHYWMVNEDAGFARQGYPWDGPRRQRFVEVLGAIVDGIERGVFAATPGQWDSWRNTHKNCRYCDFDVLCSRDRGEFAEAKAGAAELAVRTVLHPAGDVDDEGVQE
ncbi:MAG: PD-(D/E)XK nuclease family protein, partial [Acidimicrobiales bacterium]